MSDEINQHSSSVFPAAPAPAPAGGKAGWERETMEKLLFETLKEQRARRRWNIFFRLVFITLLISFFVHVSRDTNAGVDNGSSSHTALINIEGVIEPEAPGSAAAVIPALGRAFEDDNAVGILIRINSPGGSPVQAGMINDELRRLKKKHPKKPVYVVVDEMCASAAYYIASGADKIFVDKASIVGSIGVLMDGFGFTGLMEKLGVERRLMTAGENKGSLDPFSPMNAKDRAHAQAMLDEIHQQFITVVRTGRGKRLKETPEMFSGQYWSGAKAIELGLADSLGTVDSVARDVLKEQELLDYTMREEWSDRLMKRFGAAFGDGAVKAIGVQRNTIWR
ncbi:S49 family peptidase [Massilia sp. W12]|uniref:S49 family peptidase n=1 Tax=Massilia sp. W12 TaxID=3126507 RepID=UPI0030D09018